MPHVRDSSADSPDPTWQDDRFRLLVEAVKDYAIFMLDPQGHVLTWNAGAERIKGYRADEIVGRHFSTFYPPERVAAGWPDQELRVATAEGRFEEEGWRLRKDGSHFWANVVITALRDEAGRLVGFAKVTRDLTERKAAEDQARQLAAEQAARAEAEASSRAKDRYISMLAHELRNPLAPIRNGLAILRMPGVPAHHWGEALEMVDRQSRHLQRIVDDLLDVARFTHGKVELQRERLDLARLARATAEDHAATLAGTGLTLHVDVPQTPVWVWVDPARIGQIVSNLLHNAVKFTPPGGQVEVGVRADANNLQAVLTVADTGEGIPPDLLPDLFKPFAQADRTLARTGGGLGLGLAVVRGLAELHGGSAEAATGGPGGGSTFTVRLPLQPEPSALVTAEPGAEQVRNRQRSRVLVIEDHRDAAESLRRVLELLGHDVRVAYTGPEGLRAAEEFKPDVVISDIGLPELDGYEVARLLRHQPGLEKTRLVALTGYGSDEERRRGREAGFADYLVKPADPDELARIVG